jgi:hypothetical protein
MNTKKIRTLVFLLTYLFLGKMTPDYVRLKSVEEGHHERIVGEKK